jgi:hypothetical protein
MSRLQLLGEGRVGKTALYNSLMGRPFTDTSSTVGVDEGLFEMQGADMQGWKLYVRGEHKVTRLPLSLSRSLSLPRSLALSLALSAAHQRLPVANKGVLLQGMCSLSRTPSPIRRGYPDMRVVPALGRCRCFVAAFSPKGLDRSWIQHMRTLRPRSCGGRRWPSERRTPRRNRSRRPREPLRSPSLLRKR